MLGIDPGLKNLGLVRISKSGAKESPFVFGCYSSEIDGIDRLIELRQHVLDWLPADLIVIEGYSYASHFQSHQLGELGGILRLAFREFNVPWIVVPPPTLKVFMAGHGRAEKEDVMQCFYTRTLGFLPRIEVSSHEADAFGLAMMGQVYLECQKNRACLKEYPEKIRGIFEEGRLRCLS